MKIRGRLQTFKLALQGAFAGSGQPQQFVGIERPVGLPEEESEQTLLDTREQGVAKGGCGAWGNASSNGRPVSTADSCAITRSRRW